MSKKGSKLVPDPHRKLVTRSDFNEKCHVESNEEVNAWLLRHAIHNPDDHESLKLVGILDNEKRQENSYVCFWHPELAALRLKSRLFHPEMGSTEGSEAARFHEHYRWVRDFRSVAHSKVKWQRAHEDLTPDEEVALERQREWERARMEDDC